jgi:hypothetical protein
MLVMKRNQRQTTANESGVGRYTTRSTAADSQKTHLNTFGSTYGCPATFLNPFLGDLRTSERFLKSRSFVQYTGRSVSDLCYS